MAKKKKKKNRTRRLLFSLGGVLLAVVILAFVAGQLGGDQSRGTEVEVASAEIRTITQTVTASGRVQPEVEVSISPDVSGEIIRLPVVEGQEVVQGQLLARIRPDFYAAQVEQAQASVQQARSGAAQAQADLVLSELELTRQRQLFERKVVAEDAFQQAQTRHDVALASLEASQYSVASASARLRQAEEDLRKTSLYAPMAGTVSKLNVELGERVVGTSQMAGTELMIVARLEQMELEVEVNENDVVNVSLGDTASIEIDAYSERTFTGVVTEIANSARLQPGASQEQVTNFPVKVRILDQHNIGGTFNTIQSATVTGDMPMVESYPGFRPGMSGTVDIYTNTVPEVVAVPIQAVTVRDFNDVRRRQARMARAAGEEPDSTAADAVEGQPTTMREEDLKKAIFLFGEDGMATIVSVETGIADDRFIEIRSGLEGGEQVITGPFSAVNRELQVGLPVKRQKN
jgi:HlyD family secretion protein